MIGGNNKNAKKLESDIEEKYTMKRSLKEYVYYVNQCWHRLGRWFLWMVEHDQYFNGYWYVHVP